MLKLLIGCPLLVLSFTLTAQKITVSAGPEILRSFNHDDTFIGVGGSVQAQKWIKERLTLGLNTGYYKFTATKTLIGNNTKPSYSIIPVLVVIHYPLPITPNLYGEDHMGYSFVQDAIYPKTGDKVHGGFTYYFALGYTIKNKIDISVKVGRARLNKKDNPSNVNEHNLGLKLAYIF